MITVYGLKNCSTCVKAQRWLTAQGLPFNFYDLRETAPSEKQWKLWADILGWDVLINKRSQTWRQLFDKQQAMTEESDLLNLLQQYPSLMKRPLLTYGDKVLVGFSETLYQQNLL